MQGELDTILDALIDCRFDDDPTGPVVFADLQTLVTIRNVVDALTASGAGHLDRLGVAQNHGRKPIALLIEMGFAPAVAARIQRIGTSTTLGRTLNHAADGAISGEHVDAIVRGLNQIGLRAGEPPDTDTWATFEGDLLAQVLSGATPAEVMARAHQLGDHHSSDTDGGRPAKEDRNLNALDIGRTDDGRVSVSGSFDVVVGEKLATAIEKLSAPVPQPDGSTDPREAPRRRADALEMVVDMAAGAGERSVTALPAALITLSVPADAPNKTELAFGGSITRNTLLETTCDGVVVMTIVDGERVPLDMARAKRLFTAGQRRALFERDRCCIKCGAPASRTQAHHIAHWSDGGATDLANGCLLCTSCHADVHHNGWDVYMGPDSHPWLLPPEVVDPRRRPIPAYNRRFADELPNAA
ncbi:DUF222 domain-containing protein [Gordonia sp. NPDC003376]